MECFNKAIKLLFVNGMKRIEQEIEFAIETYLPIAIQCFEDPGRFWAGQDLVNH